jgi:replicative DNA helicase
MVDSNIAHRLWSELSGVPMWRTRQGVLTDRERDMMRLTQDPILNLPITIANTPGLTVEEFRARVRRSVRTRGTGLVVVDYLQLMRSPTMAKNGKPAELEDISGAIKQVANEQCVPIVALAQLNRDAPKRENKRPNMSDLRGSGAIEQDADTLLLLHREEYYHKEDGSWALEHPDEVGVAELIVEKQRNGPTGVVRIRWDAERMSFCDMPGQYGRQYQHADDGLEVPV